MVRYRIHRDKYEPKYKSWWKINSNNRALEFYTETSIEFYHDQTMTYYPTGLIVERANEYVPVITLTPAAAVYLRLGGWSWLTVDDPDTGDAELVLEFVPVFEPKAHFVTSTDRVHCKCFDPETGKEYPGQTENIIQNIEALESPPKSFNEIHAPTMMFTLHFIRAEEIQPSLKELL